MKSELVPAKSPALPLPLSLSEQRLVPLKRKYYRFANDKPLLGWKFPQNKQQYKLNIGVREPYWVRHRYELNIQPRYSVGNNNKPQFVYNLPKKLRKKQHRPSLAKLLTQLGTITSEEMERKGFSPMKKKLTKGKCSTLRSRISFEELDPLVYPLGEENNSTQKRRQSNTCHPIPAYNTINHYEIELAQQTRGNNGVFHGQTKTNRNGSLVRLVDNGNGRLELRMEGPDYSISQNPHKQKPSHRKKPRMTKSKHKNKPEKPLKNKNRAKKLLFLYTSRVVENLLMPEDSSPREHQILTERLNRFLLSDSESDTDSDSQSSQNSQPDLLRDTDSQDDTYLQSNAYSQRNIYLQSNAYLQGNAEDATKTYLARSQSNSDSEDNPSMPEFESQRSTTQRLLQNLPGSSAKSPTSSQNPTARVPVAELRPRKHKKTGAKRESKNSSQKNNSRKQTSRQIVNEVSEHPSEVVKTSSPDSPPFTPESGVSPNPSVSQMNKLQQPETPSSPPHSIPPSEIPSPNAPSSARLPESLSSEDSDLTYSSLLHSSSQQYPETSALNEIGHRSLSFESEGGVLRGKLYLPGTGQPDLPNDNLLHLNSVFIQQLPEIGEESLEDGTARYEPTPRLPIEDASQDLRQSRRRKGVQNTLPSGVKHKQGGRTLTNPSNAGSSRPSAVPSDELSVDTSIREDTHIVILEDPTLSDPSLRFTQNFSKILFKSICLLICTTKVQNKEISPAKAARVVRKLADFKVEFPQLRTSASQSKQGRHSRVSSNARQVPRSRHKDPKRIKPQKISTRDAIARVPSHKVRHRSSTGKSVDSVYSVSSEDSEEMPTTLDQYEKYMSTLNLELKHMSFINKVAKEILGSDSLVKSESDSESPEETIDDGGPTVREILDNWFGGNKPRVKRNILNPNLQFTSLQRRNVPITDQFIEDDIEAYTIDKDIFEAIVVKKRFYEFHKFLPTRADYMQFLEEILFVTAHTDLHPEEHMLGRRRALEKKIKRDKYLRSKAELPPLQLGGRPQLSFSKIPIELIGKHQEPQPLPPLEVARDQTLEERIYCYLRKMTRLSPPLIN